MSCGREEIFGPVLCIKRVDGFEEGLQIMNNSRFANGSVIYTESGHYAREFARRTDGGMVGINVGIPVPLGVFGFTGHKQSFFGDLHCMGRDGFIFYTESKNVTSTWFTGKAIPAKVEHLGRNHDEVVRHVRGAGQPETKKTDIGSPKRAHHKWRRFEIRPCPLGRMSGGSAGAFSRWRLRS